MLASPFSWSFSSTLSCLVSCFLGSLTDECLDCFHPLAVSTNDAQTGGVQIFLRDPTCSLGGRYISRNRIAGACGNSPFVCEEMLYLLSSSIFVVCFDQKDFCSCSLYVVFYIKEPYLSHMCEISCLYLISFCYIILMQASFWVKCIVGTLHHNACEIWSCFHSRCVNYRYGLN